LQVETTRFTSSDAIGRVGAITVGLLGELGLGIER
jgi:hypothetical protein